MKKLSTNLIAISLLCLFSVGAVAKDKNLKEHVTFSDDLLVGSTLVKKGDYLVKYNAPTGEVTFMDMKKHKVIATAMATVKMNDKKAESDALYTKKTPAGEKLIGLRLGGQREELTLTDTAAAIEEIPISDVSELPISDTSVDIELNPVCEWELVPISDDMEEIVVGEVDGVIPDADMINYKLVCQPR